MNATAPALPSAPPPCPKCATPLKVEREYGLYRIHCPNCVDWSTDCGSWGAADGETLDDAVESLRFLMCEACPCCSHEGFHTVGGERLDVDHYAEERIVGCVTCDETGWVPDADKVDKLCRNHPERWVPETAEDYAP